MISDKFLSLVQRKLPFELTEVQQDVVRRIGTFLFHGGERQAYMLRGFAGTGKTFMVSAIVRVLHDLGREVVLLAPTGRAAKVLSQHAGYPAYTIHKEIYRQDKAGDLDAHFALGFNKHKDAVFIVDEASMISNEGSLQATFGTGSLLDDLVAYVYSSAGCSMVLVGDNAQLPPVGEEDSPALRVDVLRSMGLNVEGYQLSTVMRQAAESGVLWNATGMRKMLTVSGYMLPKIRFSGFADIARISGADMVESLDADYGRYGQEQVVVITRSNKRAVEYNLGIRNAIFGREEGLAVGDVVMVVRNNYYWLEQMAAEMKSDGDSSKLPTNFLANGDIGVVRRIGSYYDFYDLHFADVTLQFPDYDDLELEVRVLLDALTSETPALTREQSDRLYQGVMEDYAEIRSKAERMRKLRLDPNYNALQIKYAYAVTCHKAQGGQWSNVYVDQGWLPPDGADVSYLRWLYTAFTRTTDRLYLVNWPEAQIADN
ncbi:MAG: AAA family ATPase [Bacteroidaceae bacterium]|nr:AAA family ATPase [Bacteroidaceae bacterium]